MTEEHLAMFLVLLIPVSILSSPCLLFRCPYLFSVLNQVSWWVYCSFLAWLNVLLCSRGWPETHNPLAAAFWMLGLKVCTVTPSCCPLIQWPLHSRSPQLLVTSTESSVPTEKRCLQCDNSMTRAVSAPTCAPCKAPQVHYFSSITSHYYNAFCKMSTAFKCIPDMRLLVVYNTISCETKAPRGFLLLFKCSCPGLCFHRPLWALLGLSSCVLLCWGFAIDQFLVYRLTVKVAL